MLEGLFGIKNIYFPPINFGTFKFPAIFQAACFS